MIGLFLLGVVGGFCLGLPVWLFILGRRSATYNRGYVDGLNHDKVMAEKMGRWRS